MQGQQGQSWSSACVAQGCANRPLFSSSTVSSNLTLWSPAAFGMLWLIPALLWNSSFGPIKSRSPFYLPLGAFLLHIHTFEIERCVMPVMAFKSADLPGNAVVCQWHWGLEEWRWWDAFFKKSISNIKQGCAKGNMRHPIRWIASARQVGSSQQR